MQIINRMADRMLDALAPKITAEAGRSCIPYQYYADSNCGCTKGGFRRARLCTVTSSCTQTCGACVTIVNEAC